MAAPALCVLGQGASELAAHTHVDLGGRAGPGMSAARRSPPSRQRVRPADAAETRRARRPAVPIRPPWAITPPPPTDRTPGTLA